MNMEELTDRELALYLKGANDMAMADQHGRNLVMAEHEAMKRKIMVTDTCAALDASCKAPVEKVNG